MRRFRAAVRSARDRGRHHVRAVRTHGLRVLMSVWATVAVGAADLEPTRGAEPPPFAEGEVVRLESHPARIELRSAADEVRPVFSGYDSEGAVRDVTGEVTVSVVSDESGASVARVLPEDGSVVPVADGAAELEVRLGAATLLVPVVVEGAGSEPAIDFAADIVPIFSRYGCNSGGCHGKAGGQNGFRLGLFGFAPDIDYEAIVVESRGRRVFAAAPTRSLLLEKATGALPHGGGARLEVDGPEYRRIERWIRAGAPPADPEAASVESIAVFPVRRRLVPGASQRLRVTARYTDGRVEDVTRLARFVVSGGTSETESDQVSLSPDGVVTALEVPGQAAILARYQGRVACFVALVPSTAPLEVTERPAPRGFIDERVQAKLDQLGVPSSAIASDEVFVRRAAFDICGTAPTAAEVESFLASADPEKRTRWIDELLSRDAYADWFALQWADVLRNRREDRRAFAHTIRFHRWIVESLRAGKPYDVMVRELVCAEGSISDDAPVAWYRALREPEAIVDDLTQVFLGTRIQCARCHHHPFEKWGQADYFSLANFFSRLRWKNDPNSREFAISLTRSASRLRDDEPTSATFGTTYDELRPLGGEPVEDRVDRDPRRELARWLTSPENELFARAVVNRYWKHFFGRGLVDPEDDFRDTNPATHPALLDELARDFVAHGYDLRHLVRRICTAATYQTSSVPVGVNRLDRQFYSRFRPRRLSAEALHDAVDALVGVPTRFPDVRRGSRAIELPDEMSRDYFLDVFGKPTRATACACERSADVSLSQTLHLLNSEDLHARLRSGESRAARYALDERPVDEKVAELFRAAFARQPRAEEIERAREHLGAVAGAEVRRAWEDLIWALINTKEFSFIQ